MTQSISSSMVPLSGRIEDDLYQWFISLQYPGAKSNSDKLREALKELRRQHQALENVVQAQAWMQSMTQALQQALLLIERDHDIHSEVLGTLNDNVVNMASLLISARPQQADEAGRVEDQLVRRAFSLTEALLRQALTRQASAFDPDVIRRHCGRVVELAKLIDSHQQGDNNG